MPMCREDQVHSEGRGKIFPLIQAMLHREVGRDELPICAGLAQAILHPLHFGIPKVFKPLCTLFHRHWPCNAAGCILVVVRHSANVVAAGGVIVEGIPNVAINKENVHGEIVVLDRGSVVQCRLHPSSSAKFHFGPGVGNHLIPAIGKEKAAIVVVSQDAQPLLSIHLSSMVHLLIHVAPLKSRILWLMHWSAALNIQAAPVEVVT
mmetsp:Transcript_9015/g.20038  ORF Transcript_9015/g.20038 Transcript_9015/m.20038 type:complete len:206 (-) Transcript_9015:747-1364(-)